MELLPPCAICRELGRLCSLLCQLPSQALNHHGVTALIPGKGCFFLPAPAPQTLCFLPAVAQFKRPRFGSDRRCGISLSLLLRMPPKEWGKPGPLKGEGKRVLGPPPPLPLPQSLGSLVIALRGGCRGSVSDAPARYSRHCSRGRGAGDAAGMLTAGCPGLSATRGCCLESSGIARPPPRELVSVGGREPLPHPGPLTGASGEEILEVGH